MSQDSQICSEQKDIRIPIQKGSHLMTDDLYQMPSGDAKFTRFCGGNLDSEHESCVELAQIPGTISAFILRDTKAEGSGREGRVQRSGV
jgi:hypothetical protein